MNVRSIRSVVIFVVLLLACSAIYGQDLEVDPGFTPNFTPETLRTVEFDANGKILVGGFFGQVNSFYGPKIIRLNDDGTTDLTFSSPLFALGAGAGDDVLTIKPLPDGKILIGGYFPSIGPNVRIARLNSNGTVDTTLTTKPTSDNIGTQLVRAEPLADGKFLGCGAFQTMNGVARSGLARFNSDGTLDTTYPTTLTSGGGNTTCYDIKKLSDGNILITGNFTAVNGVSKTGGAKLNADGTLDASYTLQFAGSRIFLGQNDNVFFGYFSSYTEPQFPLEIFFNTGLQRNNLTTGNFVNNTPCVTRVNSTPPFPSALGLADGRTMVTGGCTNPANNIRYPLARYKADSTFDTTFNRIDFGTSGTLSDIYRQPNGKFIALGNFGTVDGVARRNIVRLRQKTLATSAPDFDFDGDGKADLAVFRPSNGYWYIYKSTGGFIYAPWGLATDKLVAADYDNDGKADLAVFRSGTWYINRSSDGAYDFRTFGASGDIPLVGHVTADDPMDDKVDMILRNPFSIGGSDVRWQFRSFGLQNTDIGFVAGETQADKSVVADLDGDGIDEYGYFRDGIWKTLARGSGTIIQFTWGIAGDIPVPADYDGDGQADYAIFRPSTGEWWIKGTSVGVYAVRFGISTDIPVPADFDGDGRTDIAIYRDGLWWQYLSSTGSVQVGNWGTPGDIPIHAQSRF